MKNGDTVAAATNVPGMQPVPEGLMTMRPMVFAAAWECTSRYCATKRPMTN